MMFRAVVLTFALLFVVPSALAGQTPWRIQAGVGLALPSASGMPVEPFTETSVFVRILEPAPPEYFLAGGRLVWDSDGVSVSVGVRHKLYFVPWSSSGQEVLVGRRFLSPTEGRWTLGGRFGLGWPWQAPEGSLPATELDVVWGMDWTPERGVLGSVWGLALGLAAGQGNPER